MRWRYISHTLTHTTFASFSVSTWDTGETLHIKRRLNQSLPDSSTQRCGHFFLFLFLLYFILLYLYTTKSIVRCKSHQCATVQNTNDPFFCLK